MEVLWEELHREEDRADMDGWDFSYLSGRMTESSLPWSYREEILRYLSPEYALLDVDTGGGEFLRSLGHPPLKTSATEGYPPNVEFCRRNLCPLGIDFRSAPPGGALPFEDACFDVVLNRHGDLNPREIFRVLRPGGIFLTQQVGADNDRELVELLLGALPLPFPEQRPELLRKQLEEAGFSLLRCEEAFGEMRFFDLGALVWFAKVIPWEFPGFTVDTFSENLRKAQRVLDRQGFLLGRTHRILLIARKLKES